MIEWVLKTFQLELNLDSFLDCHEDLVESSGSQSTHQLVLYYIFGVNMVYLSGRHLNTVYKILVRQSTHGPCTGHGTEVPIHNLIMFLRIDINLPHP